MAKKPKYVVNIPEKDLRRDVMRAGGPGGQHQNKTESAVRYTHVPSGIYAESRSDRSQHANGVIAYERLCDKLLAAVLWKRGQSAKGAWRDKSDAAFGAQMRSYKLAGHRQVIDHDTGWEGDPNRVLDGDIDGLLRARLLASKEH